LQWGLRLAFRTVLSRRSWCAVGMLVQSLLLGSVLPPCLAYPSCSGIFFWWFLGICCFGSFRRGSMKVSDPHGVCSLFLLTFSSFHRLSNSPLIVLCNLWFYTSVPCHFPHSFVLQFYSLLTSLSSSRLLASCLPSPPFCPSPGLWRVGGQWPAERVVHLAGKKGCFLRESALGVAAANGQSPDLVCGAFWCGSMGVRGKLCTSEMERNPAAAQQQNQWLPGVTQSWILALGSSRSCPVQLGRNWE